MSCCTPQQLSCSNSKPYLGAQRLSLSFFLVNTQYMTAKVLLLCPNTFSQPRNLLYISISYPVCKTSAPQTTTPRDNYIGPTLGFQCEWVLLMSYKSSRKHQTRLSKLFWQFCFSSPEMTLPKMRVQICGISNEA